MARVVPWPGVGARPEAQSAESEKVGVEAGGEAKAGVAEPGGAARAGEAKKTLPELKALVSVAPPPGASNPGALLGLVAPQIAKFGARIARDLQARPRSHRPRPHPAAHWALGEQ